MYSFQSRPDFWQVRQTRSRFVPVSIAVKVRYQHMQAPFRFRFVIRKFGVHIHRSLPISVPLYSFFAPISSDFAESLHSQNEIILAIAKRMCYNNTIPQLTHRQNPIAAGNAFDGIAGQGTDG
ncbi:MAG: hypothetical protein LBG83_00520 [Oscillospiraceae bacterium]|nr:hypothetical protein [Oscillospiraceae bacterium]